MIKETLLTGWNFMRWLRLGLGIIISIQSVQNHDNLSGIIAAFFLFQAVTNTGCCGVNSSCAAPLSKNDSNAAEEVEFEEIKSK